MDDDSDEKAWLGIKGQPRPNRLCGPKSQPGSNCFHLSCSCYHGRCFFIIKTCFFSLEFFIIIKRVFFFVELPPPREKFGMMPEGKT